MSGARATPLPPEAAAPPGAFAAYWEERARAYARDGAGWKAVCSYGMPRFHNAAIDLVQRLALARWLAVAPGTPVLDVGCGVGRWSLRLARRGARVTGVDVSPTMVAEARARAARAGLAGSCAFRVADLADLVHLDLGGRFPLVLGVTVLQHVLDDGRLAAALAGIAAQLAPGGRAVLLEAAPERPDASCDSPVFRARHAGAWRAAFAGAGLALRAACGVDPMPLRTLIVPRWRRWPRGLRLGLLLAATAVSLPGDALLGRRLERRSWHRVFVLGHAGEAP